jgi:hypothetical protein
MYYSWFNITSAYQNNTFSYTWTVGGVTTTYPVANYYVDVTDTINFKLEGCNAHKSQVDKFMLHGFDIIDGIETLAKFRGNQAGVKYAEAFNVLKIVK